MGIVPSFPLFSLLLIGFPYIFRGALDVRASAINDEMKIAAAKSNHKSVVKFIAYELM